jgi:DNA-binding transcriptional MerR regulator
MKAGETLSLEDLSAAVGERLAGLGLLEAQRDGRIAPAPDARTIRYYTTLGLLDRPRIIDREARYGRRHVLQLVAIKALQAQSLPLAEVQERLYGKSEAELEATLAALAPAEAGERRTKVRAVTWREVTIEPGLKLLAEDGWAPRLEGAALERRIRAALAALTGGRQE